MDANLFTPRTLQRPARTLQRPAVSHCCHLRPRCSPAFSSSSCCCTGRTAARATPAQILSPRADAITAPRADAITAPRTDAAACLARRIELGAPSQLGAL